MKKTLTLLSILISLNCVSQTNKYIIVKIIQQNNSKLDSYKSSLWILPLDSLKSERKNQLSIYPFLIESISYDNLLKCKNNKLITPFLYTTNTDFNYPDSLKYKREKLLQYISKCGKLYQTISKKWNNKYTENIRIYLIPIEGDFCMCSTNHKENELYFGKSQFIYSLSSSFNEYKGFWSSKYQNQLANIDLSLYPIYLFGWN